MSSPTGNAAAPAVVPNAVAAASPVPAAKRRRRLWLGAVAAAVAVAAGAYGAYYAAVSSHYESTDNAYVQGNLVQITPQVGGTVVAIGADDTDFVKAGQPLVRLDPIDAQVALDQAEAQLAQTVREVAPSTPATARWPRRSTCARRTSPRRRAMPPRPRTTCSGARR